jgi:hypothetical protein
VPTPRGRVIKRMRIDTSGQRDVLSSRREQFLAACSSSKTCKSSLRFQVCVVAFSSVCCCCFVFYFYFLLNDDVGAG